MSFFFLTPRCYWNRSRSPQVSLSQRGFCLLSISTLRIDASTYVYLCAAYSLNPCWFLTPTQLEQEKHRQNEGSVTTTRLGKGSDSTLLLLPLSSVSSFCLQLFFKLFLSTFFFTNRVFAILFHPVADSSAFFLFIEMLSSVLWLLFIYLSLNI